MNEKSLSFLRELVETPSPSGFENAAQEVFRKRVGPFCAEISSDAMGNVSAVRNPGGKPRVMLAAHCDEIGFLVTWVNPEGFIHFQPVGGLSAARSEGQRVFIRTGKGPVFGVVGRKARRYLSPGEREREVKVEDLWIDIGARSREEACTLVGTGDPGTFAVGFAPLPCPDRAVARAFDDKAGVFVLAEVMRLLAGEKSGHEAAVHAVSTTQEEVGARGSICGAFNLAPEMAIVTDVHNCTDFPGADKRIEGEISLGGGPVITLGANVYPPLAESLLATARREKIPCQVRAVPGVTPTDARSIQVAGAGVCTALVGIPLRYMHSASEMLSLGDLENTARLLSAFILRGAPGVPLPASGR